MEVKRIYHNYCSTNERSLREEYKGKRQLMPKPTSPAMRLNLTTDLFTAEDIISFSFNKEIFTNKSMINEPKA